MERKKTVCFTGHRPEKLTASKDAVIYTLGNAIGQAYKDGYRIFISGMARGVDLQAAQIVLRMKEKEPDVQLVCASPYPGFEGKRHDSWYVAYQRSMQGADEIAFVSEEYSRGVYQKRNEWMCNHSNRLIAVWNGQPSGTANTIRYAQKIGIEVVFLKPDA